MNRRQALSFLAASPLSAKAVAKEAAGKALAGHLFGTGAVAASSGRGVNAESPVACDEGPPNWVLSLLRERRQELEQKMWAASEERMPASIRAMKSWSPVVKESAAKEARRTLLEIQELDFWDPVAVALYLKKHDMI